MWLKDYIKSIKEYNKIANIEKIARRYFAMNSFDGVLILLGILVASFIAGIDSAKIIIVAGLGAVIAIGVSGVWGAYMTEKAERLMELKRLEKLMKKDLDETKIGRAFDFAVFSISIIDGLSPFITGVIILIPFFFIGKFNISLAYYTSFILTGVMLFLLGAFLGRISKENIILNGLKMILAGIVCVVILYFLGI